MTALSILKSIHRPLPLAGAACAALFALAPLVADTPRHQSLSEMVGAEARSLETQADKLRALVRSKNAEPAALLSETELLRVRIAELTQKVGEYDTSSFDARQKERYAAIQGQLALMDQIASNKTKAVTNSGLDERRVIRYKADNLRLRAQSLQKAARWRTMTPPAARASSVPARCSA